VSERSVEQLANEWVRRLELAEPFAPAIPREGLFPEQTQRIADLYQQVQPYDPENSIGKEFYEAYRQHIEQARPELAKKLPTIRERFKDFYKNTGIADYEPIEDYPREHLAGLFGSAQHEIYAHELPYKAGLMPDYSGFYAGKNNLGNPYVFGPNSLTPFNEATAVQIDEALREHFKGNPINVTNLGNAFDNYFSYGLKQATVDPESKSTLKERVKAFYPPYVADVDSERLTPIFNKAGQLFLQKYVLPATEQYEGAVRTQFPGLVEKHGALHGANQYDALLRILDRDLAAGRPFVSTGDLYLSADPLTSAARGIPEVLSAVKKTPASLLPGAADLIPSPGAIQTGYAQGPVAMGKQMAQEFVQSLPTAAAAAGVLSTPLAAPLAPGIGAGLVGTAGARALNEVVRQETGEGIVPKVRQFLGTAPRTGVTAQPRVGERPLTATVKPLTTAQRTEIKRQENRNELQRRIDLLKERFYPRRGEFGLSEILFGR
jgi:hypothetical protein